MVVTVLLYHMSWDQTRVENKLKITLDTAKWLSKIFNLIHSHLAVKGGNHIMTNLETTQKKSMLTKSLPARGGNLHPILKQW